MGRFDLILGKVTIPLYDIATIAAGFYIGYAEGKGINTNTALEYVTKYGPTAFMMATTPLFIKTTNAVTRLGHEKFIEKFEDGTLEVAFRGSSKITYNELSEKDKLKVKPKLIAAINNLESRLQNPPYLKSTLNAGAMTAAETAIGYVAGRLYSQMG